MDEGTPMPLNKSQLASLLTGAISNIANGENIKIGPNHFVQVQKGKCNWHIPYVNKEGDSKNCVSAIAKIIDKYKQTHPQVAFDS